MFEASFRIAAQVESDGQGQRVFRITKREEPPNDTEFSSLVATLYQQEVYRTLQVGDSLTITVRLDIFQPGRWNEPCTCVRTGSLRGMVCRNQHQTCFLSCGCSMSHLYSRYIQLMSSLLPFEPPQCGGKLTLLLTSQTDPQ